VNWLLPLPLLIPLLTAAVSFVAWHRRDVQRWLGVAGALALLMTSIALLVVISREGIQATQIGNWPAPFGITLVADLFSAIMVMVAGLMGISVIAYSLASIDIEREQFGYYPLLHVLLTGVNGAFLTGDIFNLFVWFEVLLISSFVLIALGGQRLQMEGAIKYVTLNLLASVLFLTSVGITYGVTGTLNMADISMKVENTAQPGVIVTVGMMFLVAFGIKAAVFPIFFWLPASYHTPPIAVTAIFSALLTKVGVYSIIRLFTLVFTQDVAYTHTIILGIAGLTMVTGVLGAVAQYDVRRLLSFHIISQIGYLLMGLGLFTPLALAGSVFFMAHVIFSKSALFLVGGMMHRMYGTYDLRSLGGIYRTSPAFSLLFLIPALSLAGVPPLSGFFAKLALVRGGLETDGYAIVGVALAVSILTLYSMIKIWTEAFWKERPDALSVSDADAAALRAPYLMLGPTVLVGGLTVALGLAAGPMFSLATEAANQLLDKTEYVNAVLGATP
jgi:multicomponent Na+:H+ antiporter subunit D